MNPRRLRHLAVYYRGGGSLFKQLDPPLQVFLELRAVLSLDSRLINRMAAEEGVLIEDLGGQSCRLIIEVLNLQRNRGYLLEQGTCQLLICHNATTSSTSTLSFEILRLESLFVAAEERKSLSWTSFSCSASHLLLHKKLSESLLFRASPIDEF